MWTSLPGFRVSLGPLYFRSLLSSLPLAEIAEAAPEHDGQANHEEGVRAEVGRNGKVTVESRRAHLALEGGQVGRLPPDEGQERLSQVISPFRERAPVWVADVSAIDSSQGAEGVGLFDMKVFRVAVPRRGNQGVGEMRGAIRQDPDPVLDRALGLSIGADGHVQWCKLFNPASTMPFAAFGSTIVGGGNASGSPGLEPAPWSGGFMGLKSCRGTAHHFGPGVSSNGRQKRCGRLQCVGSRQTFEVGDGEGVLKPLGRADSRPPKSHSIFADNHSMRRSTPSKCRTWCWLWLGEALASIGAIQSVEGRFPSSLPPTRLLFLIRGRKPDPCFCRANSLIPATEVQTEHSLVLSHYK